VPCAAEKKLRVVVLVAVGVGTVDPGEVLVHAGAEEGGSVARLLGSVGGDGAPQLGQLDPAHNHSKLPWQGQQQAGQTAFNQTNKRFSLAAVLVLDARQQLAHDAEGGGDDA
jgi:hypothetical protein